MLTFITPPPLLPSSNAKNAGGKPIALPENNFPVKFFANSEPFEHKYFLTYFIRYELILAHPIEHYNFELCTRGARSL